MRGTRWNSEGAVRQSGEITSHTGCLALPLRDAGGHIAGGLGFSGPRHRIDDPGDLIHALRPAADALAPLVF